MKYLLSRVPVRVIDLFLNFQEISVAEDQANKTAKEIQKENRNDTTTRKRKDENRE